MPFRSESEQVREQVRRLEEESAEVEAQIKDLHERVGLRKRFGAWHVGIASAVLCACFVGMMLGAFSARLRAQEISAIRSLQRDEMRARIANSQKGCELRIATIERDIAICQKRPVPNANEPFNRGAAAEALSNVPVKSCLRTNQTFHATFTFDPNGAVSAVVIDAGWTGTEAEKMCVLAILHSVRVPPFRGEPVRVGKSFSS